MTKQIDFVAVTTAREKMAREYGATFIPASVTLKERPKAAALDLALALGMTIQQAASLSDIELISLYMAAKKPFAAQRRAEELIASHNLPSGLPGMPSAEAMPSASAIDAEALKDMILEQANQKLAAMVKRLADMEQTVEELNARTPRKLEIQPAKDVPKITFDIAHRELPKILKLVAANKKLMLVGPAGSGKSTACEQIAKALDLPFFMAASVMDPTELMGFKNGYGEYQRTPFREVYEHGGVFLLDEMDRGDAQALCSFNAAFAGQWCPFPDGLIAKHKDARFIAAVNTFGLGADRVYVGATQLDGAFLNRFGSYVFDYDPALEDSITPNKAWLKYVRAIRKEVMDTATQHIVSPRCSIEGSDTLELGFSWQETADIWLWQGLDKETRARIENRVPMHEYEPSADII